MNIFNGNFKGVSDSPYAGEEGSFSKSLGMDGHSKPGTLKVAQLMAINSGDTVTELCLVALSCSNGYKFWFSSESGKIWAELDGIYTLAYTTVPGAGNASCSGAQEYDGYIYWSTELREHRIAIANADDTWASVTLDYGTLQGADYHPHIVQNDVLFIGDGNIIASISDVFTPMVKTLTSPLLIKTFLDYDIDILIGTYTENLNKAQVLRWDTISDSISTSDAVDEDGVNAFIRDVNDVYVQCGSFGSIYLYDGQQLQAFKRIPGEYAESQIISINPNSTGVHATIPVFGVSGGAIENGVYRLGSYSPSYTTALDLTYPLSAGLESVSVGAILSVGTDLYVAWSTDDTAGIDKLDWNTKYPNAYIESPFLATADNRSDLKQIAGMIANYSSQPNNTSVVFSYKKNNESDFTELKSNVDTELSQEESSTGVANVANFQGRFDFITYANYAPEVDSMIINEAPIQDVQN